MWPQPRLWAQLKAGSEPERLGESRSSWCGGEGLAGEDAPESPWPGKGPAWAAAHGLSRDHGLGRGFEYKGPGQDFPWPQTDGENHYMIQRQPRTLLLAHCTWPPGPPGAGLGW